MSYFRSISGISVNIGGIFMLEKESFSSLHGAQLVDNKN